MKDQEIAHNFLLTDGGDTLFLLPRLKNRGRGTWHGVTPGFPELGGQVFFTDEAEFWGADGAVSSLSLSAGRLACLSV